MFVIKIWLYFWSHRFSFLVFVFKSFAAVFQERQKVHNLQQQLELEMNKLRREHERDIEAFTCELKNAERQLEQQLQQKVY